MAVLSNEELLELVAAGMHHYHAEVCHDSDPPCEHDIAFAELSERLLAPSPTKEKDTSDA